MFGISMASKGEGSVSDLRSMQRERERERRRLRDRQRRQNMSQEQRERHLARRRRNYQLRRMRAENAKLNASQTQMVTPVQSQPSVVYVAVENNAVGVPFQGQEVLATSGSVLGDESKADLGVQGGTQRYKAYPRRLSLHQIRQLARLLHTPADHQSKVADTNASKSWSRRLRLTHVKRLARSLKSNKGELRHDAMSFAADDLREIQNNVEIEKF